jgi:hypothetical protein
LSAQATAVQTEPTMVSHPPMFPKPDRIYRTRPVTITTVAMESRTDHTTGERAKFFTRPY